MAAVQPGSGAAVTGRRDAAAGTAAYIGLGSNLDDPVGQVRGALRELADLPGTTLLACSPLYRNPPMGGLEQPDYVNAVVAARTTLAAHRLLACLQRIEDRHGRRRGARWASRTLDLDLLVFGSERIEDPALTVPHPGIASRNFVLFPLCDIAPDLHIPGLGVVRQLAASLDDAGLVRLDAAD